MHCSAFGCKNRSDVRNKNVTFHKFPKNADIRAKWICAVRRKNWSPSSRSLLCSDHFDESSFDRSTKLVMLKKGAVPTIFPGCPSYEAVKNQPPVDHAIPYSIEPIEQESEDRTSEKNLTAEKPQPFLDSAIRNCIEPSKDKPGITLGSIRVKKINLLDDFIPNYIEPRDTSGVETLEVRKVLLTDGTESIYRIGDDSDDETLEQIRKREILKKKLSENSRKNRKYAKEIKTLQQKIRRTTRRIEHLKKVVEEFISQEKIDQEILDVDGTIAGVMYMLP